MSSQLTIEEYCDIKTVVFETFPDVIANIVSQYQSKEEFSECEKCSGMREVSVRVKDEMEYTECGECELTGFMILDAPMCSECQFTMCWGCWGKTTYDSTCERCGIKGDRKEEEYIKHRDDSDWEYDSDEE